MTNNAVATIARTVVMVTIVAACLYWLSLRRHQWTLASEIASRWQNPRLDSLLRLWRANAARQNSPFDPSSLATLGPPKGIASCESPPDCPTRQYALGETVTPNGRHHSSRGEYLPTTHGSRQSNHDASHQPNSLTPRYRTANWGFSSCEFRRSLPWKTSRARPAIAGSGRAKLCRRP